MKRCNHCGREVDNWLNLKRHKASCAKNEENIRGCLGCLKYFPVKQPCQKFCSRVCAAKINNSKYPKRKSSGGEKIEHCLHCASSLANHSRYSKFCSTGCFSAFDWNIYKLKVKSTGKVEGGVRHSKNSEKGSQPLAKKYLLETRGSRCESCNRTRWLGKEIPLVLDHINGNATDYKLTNLRLLCGNCNMQTTTFAGRNKGKGQRAWRVTRYQTGQSY